MRRAHAANLLNCFYEIAIRESFRLSKFRATWYTYTVTQQSTHITHPHIMTVLGTLSELPCGVGRAPEDGGPGNEVTL